MAGTSRRTRILGVTLAASLVGLGLAVIDAPGISAATSATVAFNCAGISGDAASSIGSSKDTIATFGALAPLNVDFSVDAPAKLKANSGDFTASFGLSVVLPPSLTDIIKNTLGLTQLNITNASFNVNASGPTDKVLTTTIASQVVDLNAAGSGVKASLSGTLPTTTSGLYRYTPGTSRFSIVVNKSVGPVTVNTITMECTAAGTIGTTSVQAPGAPNVDLAGMVGYVFTKQLAAVEVQASPSVTPDNGNPIMADSVRITGAPSGGLAAVWQGKVLFYSEQPGLYTVPVEVCGVSMPVPLVPGKDEVQTLTWDKLGYSGTTLNAHPIGFTLKYGGQETKRISTSNEWNGQPSPNTSDVATRLLSKFHLPSASDVETALEGLSNVGPGGVNVIATATGLEIHFSGALARKDVDPVQIGTWITWLGQDVKATVDKAKDAFLNPPAPTGPTTTTTKPASPESFNSLVTKLIAGQLSTAKFGDALGALLLGGVVSGLDVPALLKTLAEIFPAPPVLATTLPGEPDIPATSTGPLCTGFTTTFGVFPAPVQVQAASVTRTVCTKYKTVSRRVAYKYKGKTRYKYVKSKVCTASRNA